MIDHFLCKLYMNIHSDFIIQRFRPLKRISIVIFFYKNYLFYRVLLAKFLFLESGAKQRLEGTDRPII